MEKIIRVGVCKGRHEMPCSDYVFDKIEDPTNIEYLRAIAKAYFQMLWECCPHQKCYYSDEWCMDHYVTKIDAVIEIYVTGLTVAVIETVRAALYYFSGYDVVLMHYDSKTNTYYPQKLNLFVC